MPRLLAPLILVATSILVYSPSRTAPPESHSPMALPASALGTAQPDDYGPPILSNGHDAWALLWRFASGEQAPYAAGTSSISSDEGGAHKTERQGKAVRQPPMPSPALGMTYLRARLEAFDTDFIIATVADPIESHAQEDFDRSLEAIQAALATSHYSLSRFDLPWRNPLHQEAELPQERKLPDATLRPGVLLFFKTPTKEDPKPRLLLVFAVGETPTGGIHKTAFIDALKQANAICGVAPCSRRRSGRPIRILGPTFSGSAESITVALQPYLSQNHDTVRIISGSATAPNLTADFQPIASYIKPKTFETVVHDDRDTFDAIYNYLEKHCHSLPKEFGILYEEGTGYGSTSSLVVKRTGLTEIPFPFGVSELHAASSNSQTTFQVGQLSQDGEAIYPVLTPQNAGHDIVPAFSSLKQAIADRALSTALNTIQEMNLKYVGILATNVRDTVFLAQQIRRHISNIVVFVLDNDSLYLNSEVVNDLTGMLIASTYPLFPTSQLFSGRRQIGFIFSSQQQEGTYNALLALLDNDSEMLDYYNTVRLAPNSGKPPVWLSVVGSTQLWPVGAVEASETSDGAGDELHRARRLPTTAGDPPSLNDGLEPRLLKILLLFLGVSCIYVALVRLCVFLGRKLSLPSGALGEVIPSFEHAQRYYAFALLVILGTLFALTYFAFALPVKELPDYFRFPWWIKTWIAAVAVVLVPVVLLHGYFVLLEFIKERELDEGFAALVVTGAPVAWLGLLLWFGLAKTTTDQWNVSWLAPAAALRFTNIESGISVFRPLFLIDIAGLCVAYGAMRRLKLGEQLFANFGSQVPRFFGFDKSSSFQGLQDHEDRISALIRTVSLGGYKGRPLTGLLIGLAFLFVWWLFRPLGNRPFGWPFVYSFEAQQFNWLFIIAFLAVYMEIAHSAVRCALCWSHFRALLHQLSQSPLVDDFARIGDEAKNDQDPTPQLQLSMPEATFTSLYLSVEAADRLALCAAVVPRIRDQAKRLKAEFDAAVQNGRPGCADLVRAMAALSADISEGLEPFSPLRLPASPTLESEKAMLYCRRFLATRVVHYCWIMMVEFRNWLIFTGSGLFLMLMAVSSYPFINGDYLLRFSWVALLVGVSLAVTLLVQVNRDKVLSLLCGGTPGKIDWNWEFFSRLLIYAVLPILGLLGVQFPTTLSGISHLIQVVFGGAAGLKA